MNELNIQPLILAILATIISLVMVHSSYAGCSHFAKHHDRGHYYQIYPGKKPDCDTTRCTPVRRPNVQAALHREFPGCRKSNVRHRGKCVELLAPTRQSLFIIHNCSRRTVYLRHWNQGCAESAGWDNALKPRSLSALALDINQESIGFQCFVQRIFSMSSGHGRDRDLCQVNCHDYLSICEQPSAQFLVGNEGSYWVATNYYNVPSLVRYINLRGIYWQ